MTEPTADATRERKLRQIQTLLDIAADDRTPEGERENAMERAMKLMAAHGVTEMMVDSRRRAQTDELITKTIPMVNPFSNEKCLLLGSIARALNCRALGTKSGRSIISVKLFGYSSDIARVELLYTSLLLQAVNGVDRQRPNSYMPSASETREYRKNWLYGFAERVGDRLAEIEQAARRAYDEEHAGETGTELVLVSRKKVVASFYEAQVANVQMAKSRRSYGYSGYAEGQQAGQRADLGGGTGVASGARQALPSGR